MLVMCWHSSPTLHLLLSLIFHHAVSPQCFRLIASHTTSARPKHLLQPFNLTSLQARTRRQEMIAQPLWKTLAVQLLIWSSLLPFHKDTRVLPWLQTYLCHLNCLGFHHKDDQIESNSFFRAQIIKHNFSLICLKNVLCLKLTVLYLLGGIIAFWVQQERPLR